MNVFTWFAFLVIAYAFLRPMFKRQTDRTLGGRLVGRPKQHDFAALNAARQRAWDEWRDRQIAEQEAAYEYRKARELERRAKARAAFELTLT